MDAKLQMMMAALVGDANTGPLTTSRNPLKQKFYRGTEADKPKGADAEKA
jgi:hypothetical protein